MKKKVLAVLLAVAMISALAACSGGQSSSVGSSATVSEAAPETDSVTVTDMAGREVTVALPVERVVALTASDCEVLYAIGAGETLVGRGEYCDYPEEALAAPVLQSGMETNIEEIIALDPQVVFMNKMGQPKEHVDALEAAGIPVVVSDAASIEQTYVYIELLGKSTSHEAQAKAVVDEMKAKFSDIAAQAQASGKTVYFEVSPLEYGLWTAGSGTFMDELAAMLGLENAFADVQGWAEISEEQVIERDPDYIVTIAMQFGEGITPTEEILARPGWQQLKAVQGGAVYNIDSNSVSRPGPRLADAAAELYTLVYAENESNAAA